MKTVYILNAFSLNMLNRDEQLGTPQFHAPTSNDNNLTARYPRPVNDPITQLKEFEKFPNHYQIVSAVGHQDTANIFANVLNRPISFNRQTIKLLPGDIAIIGQYIGPRLPEGATSLPEGATIEWWII